MVELVVSNGRVMNKEDSRFEAKPSMSMSVLQTYSAFANTNGGTIVIGLTEREDKDGFDIKGVKNAEQLEEDIWSTLNNRELVSINILAHRDVRKVTVDGKDLIVIEVPAAHRSLRPVYIGDIDNGTYKRCASGDYHCLPMELASFFRDASPDSRDHFPTEYATIDDLDMKSVEGYRNMLMSYSPTNMSVAETSTEEFLRLLGAARRTERGVVPTYAGLMMFGKYSDIASEVAGFSLDYREYNTMGDRWDLRHHSGTLNWSGNIFDFYSFVVSRLPLMVGSGFNVPDGITREDDTDIMRMLREVVTNAIAHADYWGRKGVLIEIRPDSLMAENSGTFRIPLEIIEEGGESDPRNQTIFRMLNLIGKAERAGTGVRNVIEICRRKGLKHPEIVETPRPESVRFTVWFRRFPNRSMSIAERIESMISEDSKVTASEMASRLGVSRATVVGEIEVMKREGRLERIGGPRGHWRLVRRGFSESPR